MKTKIQKWGNSLALRIPKSFAAETNLAQDAFVEMTLEGGKLVVSPLPERHARLEELLAGVTEENRPQEWVTGPAIGGEVW